MHFQRIVLQDTEFLIGVLFPFSTLNKSFHCLLVSKVSDENSENNLIENPLHMKICLSLAASKIVSLSCNFDNLMTICISVDLWVYPNRIHQTSWICRFMYYIKFEKFSVITSLNNLLLPSHFSASETPLTHILLWLMVSTIP